MMIIISGLPGTGKSYFASRLASKLGAAYINSDVTRKDIDAQGRYAFEDKLNVYEEMANRAGEALRNGQSVVVDATFYRKEMRQMFFTLAKLLHKNIALIQIVADEQIVIDRLRPPRRDREAGLAVYRLVKSQFEELDRDRLTIESTADNIGDMLEKATAYISQVNDAN
jgi:predicted kinase